MKKIFLLIGLLFIFVGCLWSQDIQTQQPSQQQTASQQIEQLNRQITALKLKYADAKLLSEELDDAYKTLSNNFNVVIRQLQGVKNLSDVDTILAQFKDDKTGLPITRTKEEKK